MSNVEKEDLTEYEPTKSIKRRVKRLVDVKSCSGIYWTLCTLRMTITAAKPSTLIGLRGAMGNVGGKIFAFTAIYFVVPFDLLLQHINTSNSNLLHITEQGKKKKRRKKRY